jgi:Protein of unknown function (DUF2568)
VIFMGNERAGAGAQDPLAGAGPVRVLVLTARFGTELALLAVLAVAGASAPAPLAVRVILAVIGPVLAAVLWGMMIGPKARRRPSDPLRITIEIVLFLVAAVLLALVGYAVWAVIFAVVAIGVAVLVRVTAPGA